MTHPHSRGTRIPEWRTGTTELAPNAFAYVQATGATCIANAGIITGRRSTTVIDALFTPSMTRSLLDEVRRLTPMPITRLLNTHHHVDHTLGNALFPPETEIIAHVNARAAMENDGLAPVLDLLRSMFPHFTPEITDVSVRLPDTTFDGSALEFRVDQRRVQLLHFGPAHTRGDVLVHLPEERVLFMGDTGFFFVTPLVVEGHVGNWIRTARRVLDELDPKVILPGHGPVGTPANLSQMIGYLELVREDARRAFEAGASEEEAVRAIDLGEYAEWAEPGRLGYNVARVFEELRSAQATQQR
jgi:cyclase